ncbi:unnamed protein product [Coccothraustes coccothraustes]
MARERGRWSGKDGDQSERRSEPAPQWKTSRCNKGQGFALLTVALKDLTETALYFKGRSLTGQDRSGAWGKSARSHDGCGERGIALGAVCGRGIVKGGAGPADKTLVNCLINICVL